MYIPTHFSEERVPVLHDLIRQHPLATLVAQGPRGLMANHIPMEIDPAPHPFGTLVGHVSRANPFWHSYSPDVEALAVFTGPHTYVSPSWYKTTQETGKVVPTWNYAVVHAYGPMRIIEDPAWLRRLVERLTERYESGRTQPWRITDAPDDFIEKQLRGIVGIEISVTRLEGKWKVSQNRATADRSGVVDGLRQSNDPVSHAVADLVANAHREDDPVA